MSQSKFETDDGYPDVSALPFDQLLQPVNTLFLDLQEAIKREMAEFESSAPESIFLNAMIGAAGQNVLLKVDGFYTLIPAEPYNYCQIDMDMEPVARNQLLGWLHEKFGGECAEPVDGDDGRHTIKLHIASTQEQIVPWVRQELHEQLEQTPWVEYIRATLRYSSGYSAVDPATLKDTLLQSSLTFSGISRILHVGSDFTELLENMRYDLLNGYEASGILKAEHELMIDAVNQSIKTYAATPDAKPQDCQGHMRDLMELVATYPLVNARLALIGAGLSLWHHALGDRQEFKAAIGNLATACTAIFAETVETPAHQRDVFESLESAVTHLKEMLSDIEQPIFAPMLEKLEEICVENLNPGSKHQYSPVFQKRIPQRLGNLHDQPATDGFKPGSPDTHNAQDRGTPSR